MNSLGSLHFEHYVTLGYVSQLSNSCHVYKLGLSLNETCYSFSRAFSSWCFGKKIPVTDRIITVLYTSFGTFQVRNEEPYSALHCCKSEVQE